MSRSAVTQCLAPALVALLLQSAFVGAAERPIASHPPMRRLPLSSSRPLGNGSAYFVDPTAKGDDAADGSQTRPWKSINYAAARLKPGDTLYLRAGTYYESVVLSRSGTAEQPITIRSYPGELAIVDAGLREFLEEPAASWEPFAGGAQTEFRSLKSYPQGGRFGNFADSMVPFHRYLNLYDLRSTNEFYPRDIEKRGNDPRGVYCGPGAFRDPESGRIHIRLAHTILAGLGDSAYQGENDPRKLPLIIAFHDYAIHLKGVRHLRLQDLVVRGASRSAVQITQEGEREPENLEFDGMTLYGSGSAIQADRVHGLRLFNCALRGHAAPWHSRAHHKYRAYAGYLVFIRGLSEDIEIARCELTDHHDGLLLSSVESMAFHHNLVENFNDDGLEFGPKKERGRILVFQNQIARCLNPFTLHGDKPMPVETEQHHGVYIYRNILDFRQGVYRHTPAEPDASGAYLNSPPIRLAHEHGGAVHPIYYFYHNTFLFSDSLEQNLYLHGLGCAMRHTTRRVFNNIFFQEEGLPDGRVVKINPDEDFQEDGNLLWSLQDGPRHAVGFFDKFRATKFFQDTKKRYPAGWGAHNLFADPRFMQLGVDVQQPIDLRLQADSPAIDAGVEIPAAWPDPLRKLDRGNPDIGALPMGASPFVFGPNSSKVK